MLRDDEGRGGLGFPAERLSVYRDALRLQEMVEAKLPAMRRIKPYQAQHVDEGISSLVLNLGEGASEWSVAEKRRFYRYAFRSGGEAAAGMAFFARRMDLSEELELLASIQRRLLRLTKLTRPAREETDGAPGD